MRYAVIDTQSGNQVCQHSTRRAAVHKADTLDQTYGAYRYRVQPLPHATRAEQDQADREIHGVEE